MNNKIKQYLPYIILTCSLLVTLLIAWPGCMTPDSFAQYHIAKSGIYSDHHPAIMSIVWRYLDMLYQGSGLMMLFHLLLLYSAVAYGVNIFFNSKLAYLVAMFPLFPIVLVYSCKIWKDVGFAFSFLFTTMMLSHAIAKQRLFTPIEHILFWLILFYGTCVKFQAQYCAPIVIAGYVIYHGLFILKNKIKILLSFLLITTVFYSLFLYVNNLLVPDAKKNNSWEYVKIYDLAAISINTGTMYVPNFLHTSYFSSDRFVKIFNYPAVDDMVFGEYAIFRKSQNLQESKQLWQQWAKTVVLHPYLYLKHRAINLSYTILSLPEFFVIKNFLVTKLNPDSYTYKIIYYTARVAGYVLVGHVVMVLLSILYLFLGAASLGKIWAAYPLIIFNSINCTILLALFFCSMAGTPRYTYIVACLTSASHAFAWVCFKNKFNLTKSSLF